MTNFRIVPVAALVLAAMLLLLAPCTLRADVTGQILGIATDASGSAVPGVKVVATNLDTNLSQQTTTSVTGEYRFLSLPVGKYKVEAELQGFQKILEENIVLTVNEQRRVDLTMQVGSVQQQIEVMATTVQVETASTQLGQVIDEKTILSLPLNGRSYIDLLSIQAGVAPTSSATGL